MIILHVFSNSIKCQMNYLNCVKRRNRNFTSQKLLAKKSTKIQLFSRGCILHKNYCNRFMTAHRSKATTENRSSQQVNKNDKIFFKKRTFWSLLVKSLYPKRQLYFETFFRKNCHLFFQKAAKIENCSFPNSLRNFDFGMLCLFINLTFINLGFIFSY